METDENFPRTRNMGARSRAKPQDIREAELSEEDLALEQYIKHATKGQLWFPTELIPNGMQYSWQAQAVYGQIIPGFSTKDKLGWKEVPQERHPGYPTRVNDQILCERPISIKARIDKYEEDKQKAMMGQYKSAGFIDKGLEYTNRINLQQNRYVDQEFQGYNNYYKKPGQY